MSASFSIHEATSRRNVRRASLLVVFIALAWASGTTAADAQDLGVVSVRIEVFRDGLVRIETVAAANVTSPTLTVELLSSSVETVIVSNENDTFLDYTLDGNEMTVVTLGSSRVTVEYDSWGLTSKQGGVWTIALSTPYNATMLMPTGSEVIYLNEAPSAISSDDDRILMTISPGSWEVSYVLEIVPPVDDSVDGGENGTDGNGTPDDTGVFPWHYLLIAVSTVVLVSLTLLLRRRRHDVDADSLIREHPDLRMDERRVLQLLSERGGNAFESEIRDELDLPKATAWRTIRRLEDREVVTVRKVGRQNRVSLSSASGE